jgi:hypothetical protein
VGALRKGVAKIEKCGLFSQAFDEPDVNPLTCDLTYYKDLFEIMIEMPKSVFNTKKIC